MNLKKANIEFVKTRHGVEVIEKIKMKQEESKHKSCPFCGGKPILYTDMMLWKRAAKRITSTGVPPVYGFAEVNHKVAEWYGVKCADCGATTMLKSTPHDAVTLWDRQEIKKKSIKYIQQELDFYN